MHGRSIVCSCGSRTLKFLFRRPSTSGRRLLTSENGNPASGSGRPRGLLGYRGSQPGTCSFFEPRTLFAQLSHRAGGTQKPTVEGTNSTPA